MLLFLQPSFRQSNAPMIPCAGAQHLFLRMHAMSNDDINYMYCFMCGTCLQSLRAGTVDSSNPYRFDIPPTWSEQRVSNTQSGNYCQVGCSRV